MSLIVQKFGGTSVANTERLKNVADIVTKTAQAGNQVVVVVSAQGDTTDDLIVKAAELNDRPSKREMDVLLNTGEMISMSLLAMAIQKLGFPVVSLTGWQIGLETNSNYSDARIKRIAGDRLKAELDNGRIVIVAGFQGINQMGDVTTLGRGGSDTTAVAIAATLGADLCQIYTDVDGVYTADPRIVKDAKKLDAITYDEMLELASLGAQVLHNRSVEMAKKYNVDLEVVSSFTRNPGTKVKEGSNMEKLNVSGVARDNNCARVAIINLDDTPGTAFKVFSLMAKHHVNIDIILQSVGRDNKKSISFTIRQDDAERVESILRDAKEMLGYEDLSINTKVAKVSIVGAGPAGLTCAGDLARMGYEVTVFEALHTAGGVLMYGIPEFRLPKTIVQKEIDTLKDLGVEFVLNFVVGRSETIDELFGDGYEAIFVGSGAGLPTFIGVPGENANGVYSANEYLTRINLMKAYKANADTPIYHAKKVAVVGGGNVAMDAARCTKRMGAEEVYIVYRRSEKELPARLEEIHHAKEEGVVFKFLTAPLEVLSDENFNVTGLKCQQMELGEPDASGRRRPIPVEGSEFVLDLDCVIAAIGTSPNPLIRHTTPGLDTNRKGCIVADDEHGITSKDGVFAGGDAVTGAATVILAMGAGKRAAAAMDEYIKNKNK